MCVFVGIALLSVGRAMAAPFAAVVMDARTGEILHSTNHDTRLHPASLTKMMTLYVAFEAIQNGEISLDTMVSVSRRASREPPSRLGLREGQRIALRHLIRAAALRSGNDAATAIAEAVGGSVEGFAARMNRTAAAIGMRNTNFVNAHGLTQNGHLSTARDMTLLGRQLYFDFPQYYNIFSRRSEDAGIAHVRNTNSRFLDGYSGADGIKTGFTNAAGYNLTAMAERGGVRVIVTVFGGRSVAHRHEQVVQLMDRGFRQAPSRVAVRRPSPPNYSNAPQVVAAGETGRLAGRVIRLQTAPERSPFPARRPVLPSEQPSEALLAVLQQEITSVLAEAVLPAAQAAPDIAASGDVAAAPDRSPVPAPRPEVEIAAVAPAETDADADLALAQAAGFRTMDAQEYLDLTSEEDESSTDESLVVAVLESVGEVGAPDETETGAEIAIRLPLAEPSVELASEMAPPAAEMAELRPAELPPVQELVASVVVADGLVMVPGLPPVAFAPLPQDAGGNDIALDAPAGTTQPAPVQSTPIEPVLVAVTNVEPSIDSRIVLTASDSTSEAVQQSEPMPMPEIVTRVSTSGGRLWSVDLGLYPSRFDAERAMLRVALSENSTLGSGVRRVGQRSGRFVASIHSLSQEQAELACLRLTARAQTCDVVQP